MSEIPTITELELKSLVPAELDGGYLARLTACAEETYARVSGVEAAFENQLRAMRPARVPAVELDRLLGKIGDTPFAVNEKIVLFNKANAARAGASERGGFRKILRFDIAAAAAVALLGSMAALMLPTDGGAGGPSASGRESAEGSSSLAVSPSHIAPVSRNRIFTGTVDEGVVWQSETQPLRVLRHTFNDRVTRGGDGGVVSEDLPHVEYSLVPEKVD